MKTAAIYARFSTDHQSERSIDDQVRLCRAFAEREGLDVVATFDDRARSGGSTRGRDGLSDLLVAARDGKFKILVVEALDRLSRDMEDLAGLHKRLTFLGVEIRAVHEGPVNTILVGLRGLIGQMYREDNAHKIRRGQAGRAAEGLAGGGLTYGYAPVEGAIGTRRIVEEEAAVVRRIFAAYIDGGSPRDIAASLNRDDVASPRGGLWNSSTILGNGPRGAGILRNELYAGRMTWNKSRMVRDPDTGRRLSRPNPRAEWIMADVPGLAIVTAEVFAAAVARLGERHKSADRMNHRRPPRLLSGLLRCAACGAGMAAAGRDRSGRMRIRCAGHIERGSCPAPATHYLDAVERTTVDALHAEMRAPAMLAEYVRTYTEERSRLAAGATAARETIERRLRVVGTEAERIIDWMIKGTGDQTRLATRANELAAEEQDLRAQLASAPWVPPKVVTLHPGLLAKYEAQLANLCTVLGRPMARGDSEAAAAIRELVETVIVHRPPDGGTLVEIRGRLTALLGDDAWPNGVRRVSGGSGSGGGI